MFGHSHDASKHLRSKDLAVLPLPALRLCGPLGRLSPPPRSPSPVETFFSSRSKVSVRKQRKGA